MYYFYKCTNPECSCWYYTNREIKGRKCVMCHKYFPFKDAEKREYNTTLSGAVKICQFLKEEEGKK